MKVSKFIIYGLVLLLLVSLAFPLGCKKGTEPGTEEPPLEEEEEEATTEELISEALEDFALLAQLYFELEDLIGKKVWALGYYGDDRFTGDGVAFLVDIFNRLLVDEQLPHHSFARLDGDLPPYEMNGTEILVYGEVKDFTEVYGKKTMLPTPLITVEQYYQLDSYSGAMDWDKALSSSPPSSSPVASLQWWNPLSFTPIPLSGIFPAELTPGTVNNADANKPGDCDRALVISGGVDANNNHSRYKDNVEAKFKKLTELGFSKEHIDVLYNNGAAINVDGSNITDGKTTKQKIKDTIEKYGRDMTASCTLTIFVTDHGTGFNSDQGYQGARPAVSGTEMSGKTYAESTFKVDLKHKVFQRTTTFVTGGKTFRMQKSQTGEIVIHQRVGGNWVYRGGDTNKDGFVSESEIGTDINGDGVNANNRGWRVNQLEPRLQAANWYYDNAWDSDGDGTNDVRARFDGTRYVFERKKADGTWGEMGRDTNGDNIIDNADGGIDWNLDGDKNDRVGFHEGINLWGSEVLWDDEFATMLKPLSDKGIHILVEMISCFSGGFVKNLEWIVEKICTGSSEDTKHYNRVDAAGKVFAADQKAFMESLSGIDIDSWNTAWDKAVTADRTEWQGEGSHMASRNHYQRWEKPVFTTESVFEEKDGLYTLYLKLSETLKDKVYDFEIIFGLQKPRWKKLTFPEDLPEGMQQSPIPGGIRVVSDTPLSVDDPYFIKIQALSGSKVLRIQLTDKDHKPLGYILPKAGTIPVPPPPPPVIGPPSGHSGDTCP